MPDLSIGYLNLQEKNPYEMMESISWIKNVVLASCEDITLRFGNKYICPLFALIIMALNDEMGKKDLHLCFRPTDIDKNPEMYRFIYESGLLDTMAKQTQAVVEKHRKSIPTLSAIERRVVTHTIDLKQLNNLPPKEQHDKALEEAFAALSTIKDAIKQDDLIAFACKLIELFNNAMFHSSTADKAYSIAVQLRDSSYLVAIYDLGIGIPGAYNRYRDATISSLNLGEKTDEEAILWATQKGNSTLQLEDGFSRGVGLSCLKDFIKRYKGSFIIASNHGYYCYEKGQEYIEKLTGEINGTLLMLKIPQ